MDMGIIHSLKCHYKNELLRRKIEALNCDVTTNPINILEAMHILKKCWVNKVTAITIKKCFNKAGFPSEIEVINEADEAVATDEVFEDDAILVCQPSLVQPRPLAQPDYYDLEDGFVVEGQQDDDFCELAVPSAKEAFTTLNTVRNFLLAEGLTEESFQLEKITSSVSRVAEEKLKQKTITDYFHVCIWYLKDMSHFGLFNSNKSAKLLFWI